MATPKKISLGDHIAKVEVDIVNASLHLATLKAKLKVLQHRQSMQLGIKWVNEIRKTLATDDNYCVVTIGMILFNIQAQYGIKPDRNIKNKIATTLSRLYNEGEVCKTEYKGQLIYGYPEAFESDRITVKEKYVENIRIF